MLTYKLYLILFLMKAIVLHSIVPVRDSASEGSEQLTQLRFAQTCTVLERQDNWTLIRNDADTQQGWVDTKMITPLSEHEWDEVQRYDLTARVRMPLAYAVSENNGQTIPLTGGTCLPDYREGRFSILGVPFRIDSNMVADKPVPVDDEHIMQLTRFYLNTPYLWGGVSAMGMDCSGFTQTIYLICGKQLLRNAREQVTQGVPVEDLSHAQAGDLVFFDHGNGNISHVGMLLDSSRVIHCSGRVKVEKIDSTGIFSVERGNIYTHQLVAIRRYKD